MTSTTLLSNKEITGLLKKPKEMKSSYLEVTGIKKQHFSSSLPRDVKKEIEFIIGTNTTTIWIKKP